MAERPKPYIGVSGVSSPEMQQQVIDLFNQSGLRKKRNLMLGVKTIHSCQWLDQPWSRDEEWDIVGREAFQGAAERSSGSVNIAQAYFDANQTGDGWYRNAFLERIYSRGANWIDGIQFDSYAWHKNKDLMEFLYQTKEQYPGTQVYLQCHEKSMLRYPPKQMARVLGAHAEALDYILFDSSHGKGVRLDVSRLIPYIDAAYSNSKLDSVGVAIAGGLHGPVVREELTSLVNQYPDISWDAEGRLRPVADDGSMRLDMLEVADYFSASAEVIAST